MTTMDTLLIEIVTPARLEAATEACLRLLSGHSGTEGSEQSCVRLGESPGKGLGVFAARACEKGEVLTTYPAHAVGRMCGGGRMAWTTRQEYSHSHLDRMARDYTLALPGKHISGDPDLHEEGLGHMINDASRSHSPADVAVYRNVSLAKQNAVPYVLQEDESDQAFDKFLVQMRASRDIAPGAELFFSYGAAYWAAVSR